MDNKAPETVLVTTLIDFFGDLVKLKRVLSKLSDTLSKKVGQMAS